jgi:hypothetical protein
VKRILSLLIGKALRAWSGSVVICAVVLLAVWGIMMHQLRNTQNISSTPTERLEHAGEAVLITAGVAFDIAATFVYIPTFVMLDAFVRRPLNRSRALLVGGILALVPRLLIPGGLRRLNPLQPGCFTGFDTWRTFRLPFCHSQLLVRSSAYCGVRRARIRTTS